MNIRELRYFTSLSYTQHYQRTADLFGVSQPAVSRAIASLEQELGAPLFERSGRNVVLTRYGRIFAEHTRTALHELDNGIGHIRELTDPSKKSIEISANFAVSVLFLPDLMCLYQQEKEQEGGQVFFQFRQSSTPLILQDVRDGISEIGFCSFLEDQPEFRFEPVFRCEMGLLVPRNHELTRLSSVSLADVADWPVVLSVDTTHYVENMFKQLGREITISCRMNEDHAIAALVGKGFGVAVVPWNDTLQNEAVELLHLSDECAYRIFYMATSRTRLLSAHAADFRRFILAHARFYSC